MNQDLAQRRKLQTHYLSIALYAVTLGLGLAAFVLADGRSWTATLLGAGSFASAALTFLTARASIRWAKAAK